MAHTLEKTLRLPRLVSDGMVLQQAMPIDIWGWAPPGQAVSVRFLGCTYNDITDSDCKWRVTLPAMQAGGPYDMDITADRTVTLRDILVGDVWVCAGQSNMQLTMERVRDKYPEDVSDCRNPNIRLFTVPQRHDFKQENDDVEAGEWITPGPDNILLFTAVGYFFAKELYSRCKVPVGLIAAAIGGSHIDAWLSAADLKAFPEALERVKPYQNDGYFEAVLKKDQEAADAWLNALQKADQGNQEIPWFAEKLDTTDWNTIALPSFWADEGLGAINGVVWFRKEIEVPASMTGVPVRLELGRIVDSDTAYVNGTYAGSVGYQYPPRKYDLPAGLLRPGKNVIAIRVVSAWGRGGFIKDKPYRLTAGGQSIDLTGEWQYKIGAVLAPAPPQLYPPSLPLSLYNGMITPLFRHRIKGVLWYQGESNLYDPYNYLMLFKTLIASWRRGWGQGDFPFLFVQLPNFEEELYQEFGSAWSLIREAQLKALEVPNTAMAVAIDLGEWNDIHPLDKKNVAHRLFLAARHTAYGENDLVWSGPIFQSACIDNGGITVTFDHTGSGLVTKDGAAPGGFELGFSDGTYTLAQAEIAGSAIRVLYDADVKPTAIRYAWADNPKGANLYNAEGLPASPFRAVIS